ncbi:MAG: GTP-binding protein [Burkholderiaceae bacterium]|nr:GTP-binding protein [Burkholderiaceae bacterium]
MTEPVPVMQPVRTPIPMVVVGGYLGAGKTTLLNRLLGNAAGMRIAVLVNDFGEINIDAALIRTRSDDVIQLENGCVCCSIGDRLVQALAEVSDREERPDLLVIEASGVSDPMRIAQVGMLDAAFRLNAVVVAVDVQQLQAHLEHPLVGDMVRQQIGAATALVLTKCDLAQAPDVQHALQALRGLAPRAAAFRALQGAIPMSVFLDEADHPARAEPAWLRAPRGSGRWQSMAGGALLHEAIGSFSFRSATGFHKQRLKQVLRNMPGGLLRAKGIVRVQGEADAQEFHVVGGRVRVARMPAVTLSAPDQESVLVFIGCMSPDDRAQITRQLESALAP